MDVSQVKKDRETMEDLFLQTIQDFEKETGCIVESVEIVRSYTLRAAAVHLSVRVP